MTNVFLILCTSYNKYCLGLFLNQLSVVLSYHDKFYGKVARCFYFIAGLAIISWD